MKILFQNYTNPITTEPRYMSHAMKMAGLESEVWDDQSVSVYDILDSYKPDVLLHILERFQMLLYNTSKMKMVQIWF